jgi:hypothetical protein
MIRNQRVTMKISSVTRHSYANEKMWNRFGQPKSQPTGINYDSKGYLLKSKLPVLTNIQEMMRIWPDENSVYFTPAARDTRKTRERSAVSTADLDLRC